MKRTIGLLIAMLLTCWLTDGGCCGQNAKMLKAAVLSEDSLAVLTRQAEAGDAEAQNLLGCWYYKGWHVEQDYQTAAKWWAQAAKQGNARGVGNLAVCYQLGRGLRADSVMAMKLYFKAIEMGNQEIIPCHERAIAEDSGNLFSAQLLYLCYSRGKGVAVDQEKAWKYSEILAEHGDAGRQFSLALDYINHQQYQRAVPWLRMAMQQNHVGATFYLGKLMFQGQGVEQDKEQGIALMEKTAASKFPGACMMLGKIYLNGDGVEADAEKGAAYLKEVAGMSSEAGWLLGLCYLNGHGVPRDYSFAVQWLAEYAGSNKNAFSKLLEDDNEGPFSQYLLGLKYYYVNRDYDAAMACFKIVEKAKCPEGTLMQALCLAQTDYRHHHYKKAFKLMRNAAKTLPAANYYLALMYENGTGVEKDRHKAVELLQKAADGGFAAAQCALGDRYMEGLVVPCDYVKAAKLYLEAEKQRQLTVQSAKNLALCYSKQVSVLPDLNDAQKRIEKLNRQAGNTRIIELLRLVEK